MYLPKNATIEEACEWLQHQTGDRWTLPRLLEEAHLVPHFWLDSTPETAQIFEGRPEGQLMRMVFASDLNRLSAQPDCALAQIYMTPAGHMVKTEPPLPVALDELRFKREDVQDAAAALARETTPAPVVADSASNAPACDLSILATREQLIEAFGRFTSMDASWFKNIKDTPALLAARKVTGQGGRGHIAEPWFCPFEVMQWLADSKRRKGRKLSTEKAWELLEKNFPKVHSAHSVADPRASD